MNTIQGTWNYTIAAFINYSSPIIYAYDFNAHLTDYVLNVENCSIETLYNLLIE